MYAVIKTGGKQYRVHAGDLLIVEKLEGEPGVELAFDEVLMIGEGAAVTLGNPTVAGASVSATLVETRKGEKIKVFKKIRRQGYRRTRGHRQFQSVLRVTGIAGDGQSETWDGTVDLTPLATLNARARNLARGMEAAQPKAPGEKSAKVARTAAPSKTKAAKPAATKVSAKAAETKVNAAKARKTPAKAKASAALEPAKSASGRNAEKLAEAGAKKNAVKKPDGKKPDAKKLDAKTGGGKKPAAKAGKSTGKKV